MIICNAFSNKVMLYVDMLNLSMLRRVFNKRDDFLIVTIYDNDCQKVDLKFKLKLLIIDVDEYENDEFREYVIRECRRWKRIEVLNLLKQSQQSNNFLDCLSLFHIFRLTDEECESELSFRKLVDNIVIDVKHVIEDTSTCIVIFVSIRVNVFE